MALLPPVELREAPQGGGSFTQWGGGLNNAGPGIDEAMGCGSIVCGLWAEGGQKWQNDNMPASGFGLGSPRAQERGGSSPYSCFLLAHISKQNSYDYHTFFFFFG